MGERIGGLKQELKGKILRKPELVQKGHEQYVFGPPRVRLL